MAQFGHRPFYALREDMSLDQEGPDAYLSRPRAGRCWSSASPIMVWQYLVQALERTGRQLNLPGGILVHSGGWKKLQEAAVDPDTFRRRVHAVTGVGRVINFYGMVEQVGGVYFENPIDHLHAPIYSEVIIRDPLTLTPVPDGQPGLVQVLSCLPTSYPGHSLLTEDLGVIRGVDPEGTGMGGRCFEILGRVPKAELRGCSDTFTAARHEPRAGAASSEARPWHADRRPGAGAGANRRRRRSGWVPRPHPAALGPPPFAAARMDTLARLSAALLADPCSGRIPPACRSPTGCAGPSSPVWRRSTPRAGLASRTSARPGGAGAASRAGQRGHVVHLFLGAGLSVRQRQRRAAVAGAGHHREALLRVIDSVSAGRSRAPAIEPVRHLWP